jgi:ubiquinone/menaquinone biosynthesis C-methylase UbiE
MGIVQEDPERHYFSSKVATDYDMLWSNVRMDEDNRKFIDNCYNRFYTMLPKNGIVLDAGCGTGIAESYLLREGFNVIGVDYSEDMLKIAREKAPSVNFRRMDIRKLEFKEGTFDGILCAGGVLIHIMESELDKVFGEFARVLAKSGAVFITTRAAEEQKEVVEEAHEGGKINVNYHTRNAVESSMQRCGFSIVNYAEEWDAVGRLFKYMYVHAKKA